MTRRLRLVATKSGPHLSPLSLEQQLERAVAFQHEKFLQLNCVPSDSLPSAYALHVTQLELEKVVSR